MISSVRGGLSLSFACVNWSEPDERQQNPEQSNSRLPIRLASPMKFYQEWIQQAKVPPDRTASLPVNAQSNCPVEVELDEGDVRDQFPASAVGLQAESTPTDSTGSNSEDQDECPSVSPIVPVSEPIYRITRVDTVMSASNCNGRPDDNNPARHPRDEAIYNNVQVEQTHRDSPVSHIGVPVASECYNDVHTSNTEVRVQGASPPADQRVLRGRAKGRTSSTPSSKFVYACIRRSNTASFRSTVSSLQEKLKSDTALGGTKVAPESNLKFDSRIQSVRCSTATAEDSPSPSSHGCSLPSQFDFSCQIPVTCPIKSNFQRLCSSRP